MTDEPRNTIQAVAMAMLDSDIDQGHANADSPWGRYEVLACAAIEAMRVPTDAMIEQIQEQVRLSSRPGQFESLMRDEITAIWQCGIDEALR